MQFYVKVICPLQAILRGCVVPAAERPSGRRGHIWLDEDHAPGPLVDANRHRGGIDRRRYPRTQRQGEGVKQSINQLIDRSIDQIKRMYGFTANQYCYYTYIISYKNISYKHRFCELVRHDTYSMHNSVTFCPCFKLTLATYRIKNKRS